MQEVQARLLTVDQAAKALSVSRATVWRLVAAGRLEAVHIGRSVRIPAEALDDFVARLRRAGESEVRDAR